MATDEQIKARADLIKHLASLTPEEAAAEINIEAALLAGNNERAMQAEADKLKQEVANYQEITAFDKVAGVFTDNSVTGTVNIDANGIAGQTYKVQQNVPFPAGAGAVWANGAVNLDDKGNVTGGDVGANHVGIPGTVHVFGQGIDYVEVANANLNIPKNGSVTAENASFLLGGIAKRHGDPDATNVTGAVITNGAGSEVTMYGRASKPLYHADGLTVTGFEENSYGINGKQLNVGTGVRIDQNLGHGKSVYLQGSATAADVTGGNPNITGKATAGVLWGGKETESELSKNLVAATAKQEPARITSEGLRQGLDAAAKVYVTLPAESQQKLVNDIAEHLLPANTFNSTADARNYVANELNARTQVQDPGQSPGG